MERKSRSERKKRPSGRRGETLLPDGFAVQKHSKMRMRRFPAPSGQPEMKFYAQHQ